MSAPAFAVCVVLLGLYLVGAVFAVAITLDPLYAAAWPLGVVRHVYLRATSAGPTNRGAVVRPVSR